MASPTVPAPTPTPASPRVVDDFSDPSRYSSEQNALGFYTGDDGTVTNRTTVQADWLLLSYDANTYWYTTLGAPNTCNDYSQFTNATPGSDGWLHIDLPLTNITDVDFKSMRAISLAKFASAGQVEVDYIYFS
ncbi:hypothetical protein BGX26_006290 [Mortierella sp. AD094]|nr:hypothetical protein BGX26_006290 [Mortierella sp. AD094]